MTDSSRLLPHGLLSPALLSQTGLTAATMAEVMKLQKVRMMMGFHGNGDQHRQHNGAESGSEETGGSEVSSLHINTMQQHSALLANRLSELPFMVAPYHLPVGLPPTSITMAMNQMSQLSNLANMAAMTQLPTEEGKESPGGSPSPCPSPSDDEIPPQEPTSQSPSRASSSASSSSSPPPAHTLDLDDSSMPLPLLKPAYEKLPLSTPPANRAFSPFLLAEGLSSMETLLTNIQGLLKVAVESARSQDKNTQQEKKELKLELERERDARHTLQKQLSSELHTRVSIQRRLKKEKKSKRKLQEALDFESRRREHVERSIKHLELSDS
ncbi:dachshund homolog 2-like [Scomber scombrus]|uniref:Dachshund homolog 2-like n=1 Tax=Scomber scombrus TaxID=13677 RepID=A0AAV1QEF1_SCOSC